MSTNLYEILGVSRDATTIEINKAFRQKALIYHPDKTSALSKENQKLAEEEFKTINNARYILTDSTRRQEYDQRYTKQPIITRQSIILISRLTKFGLNGRVKLKCTTKSTITSYDDNSVTIEYKIEIEKNSLDPMRQSLEELEKTLNNKAFELDNSNQQVVINDKYQIVANKMRAMRSKIENLIITLNDTFINYKTLIDCQDMIDALQEIKKIVNDAQNDGEFANHRSFGRNCPVLRELCVCLDLMVNFFAFLDEKIRRTIFGNKTPVFANMQKFKCGMFKPIPASTARKVDELKEDIEWYIKNASYAKNFVSFYSSA